MNPYGSQWTPMDHRDPDRFLCIPIPMDPNGSREASAARNLEAAAQEREAASREEAAARLEGALRAREQAAAIGINRDP